MPTDPHGDRRLSAVEAATPSGGDPGLGVAGRHNLSATSDKVARGEPDATVVVETVSGIADSGIAEPRIPTGLDCGAWRGPAGLARAWVGGVGRLGRAATWAETTRSERSAFGTSFALECLRVRLCIRDDGKLGADNASGTAGR